MSTATENLEAAVIVAEVQLREAKWKAEECKAAAEVENAKDAKCLQASLDFSQAYYAWLAAKAGLEDPDITDDEQPERWKAETDAERRLFSTPATCAEGFWDKLTAFETILGEELTIGLRNESILMLAMGSIKQDIINLELCG
jgi:hypothetical protein